MVTATRKYECIGKWLQSLLANLQDGDKNPIFKKVLLGFEEASIKTFGDGVLATCYITNTDYAETFGIHNRPTYIHSVIAFIIKGNTAAKYDTAVKIMDILQENLETNHDWQKLETPSRIVRDTDVINANLTLTPVNKKLSIIGFIELRHHVYK